MGVYLIIFGTRGVTYTRGQGTFHCPACGEAPYRVRRVRRFFTLYFVPLIPLDLLGEYVECRRCKDTFKPAILELSPGAADFEAEFPVVTRRLMALMALADGEVSDEELETVREIYNDLAKEDLSRDEIAEEIEAARDDRRSVEDYTRSVIGSLNDRGKELVLSAALMVAAADGEFRDEERELVGKIGDALEMSSAHVKGVIAELLASAEA
jgi:tellurite resistance protein